MDKKLRDKSVAAARIVLFHPIEWKRNKMKRTNDMRHTNDRTKQQRYRKHIEHTEIILI